MGIIRQGILGGFKGKTGTVIGGTWKGISYMRGLSQSQHDSKTEAQLLQRAKFKMMVQTLRPMSPVVNIGFKYYAERMTSRNAAMKYNIRACLTGTAPENLQINWELLTFALGPLTGASQMQATYDSRVSSFIVSWSNEAGKAKADDDDVALVLVYNATQSDAISVVRGTKRSDLSLSIMRPRYWKEGDECNVYLAFTSSDGDIISNSHWVGAVTL